MLFDDRSMSTQLSSITPAAHHLELLLGVVWNQLNKIRKHLLNMGGKIYFIPIDFEIINGTKFKSKSGQNPRELMNEVKDLYKFIEEKLEANLKNVLRPLN